MYDRCQEWLRDNLPDEFEQCKFTNFLIQALRSALQYHYLVLKGIIGYLDYLLAPMIFNCFKSNGIFIF